MQIQNYSSPSERALGLRQSHLGVFNTKQGNPCAVENAPLDLTSNPNGTVTSGSSVPKTSKSKPIPQRVRSLEKRVGALEKGFVEIRKNLDEILLRLQNMKKR